MKVRVMTSLIRLVAGPLLADGACVRSGGVFLRDAGHGMLEVSHNSLALFGLLIVGVALFASAAPTSATPSRRTR